MSYKQAIINMCKTCIYDDAQPGTWLQQVKQCTSSTCPLFSVRPGAKKPTTKRVRKLSEEHKRKLQEGRKRAKI